MNSLYLLREPLRIMNNCGSFSVVEQKAFFYKPQSEMRASVTTTTLPYSQPILKTFTAWRLLKMNSICITM